MNTENRTAPKLTKAQSDELKEIASTSRSYTYEDEQRHTSALELKELGLIDGPQRAGFAFYWVVNDAGLAALKNGAK